MIGEIKKALIPYYTFSDPTESFSKELIEESFRAGADIVEIGFPFSDPIADGPVIQASHQRVLEKRLDVSLNNALAVVKSVRSYIFKPIIFMLDVNLILQFGIEIFFKSANAHGLNGVIIPNLPVEEALAYQKMAQKYKVDLIFLLSPLTSGPRMQKIVKASTGFVYLIATTGTTGERKSVAKELKSITKAIKKIKDIPVVVGFGISKPEHYKEVCSYADGVIVGSHFVKMIELGLKEKDKTIQKICRRIKTFKAGL